MKRFLIIIIIISLILNFSGCSDARNLKTVRVGVIDSCISCEIQEKYHITEMNDIILEGKTVEFSINGTKFQKREVSFLTAYVCATIANQISKGKTIEEILNRKNLNKIN